ncbi:MAG: TM2 domain-containing protein [Dehalococcoidia bacterium]
MQSPAPVQAAPQFTPKAEPLTNKSQDQRKKKDPLIAYVMWLCLGCHYIYLEKRRTQIIFWLTGGGLIIWWLIDLFRIPGMVSDYNIDQLLNAVLRAEAEQKQTSSKDNRQQ